MDIDVNFLKKLVDDTIVTESKCVEVVRLLLVREGLNNPTVDKVIKVLSVWSTTPPVETLKNLEDIQSQTKQ